MDGGSSSRFLTTYVVVIALSCIVRWRGSSMGASRSGVWHCPPSVVLPAPHASESHGAHRTGWLGLHGIVGVLARAWHGMPKKNFTQRSQRSLRGHSNSPVGGAFGLEGRSTRLAQHVGEEFHTEIAKGNSTHRIEGYWRTYS
jgi:hypothetical protein